MKKIKVIYILGFGHSGSTLLDLILGKQIEVESVGELVRLKKEINWNGTCTCGVKLIKCDYWKCVLERFVAKLKNDNDYEYISKEIAFNIYSPLFSKISNLFFNKVFNKKYPNNYPDIIDEYGKRNYCLYSSILEHTKKKVIIDSSKSHRRLLFLVLSNLFDIKVIYLYRNGYESLSAYRNRSKNLYKEIIEIYSEDKLEDWYKKRIKAKLNRDVSFKDVFKYFLTFKISHSHRQRILDFMIKKGFDKDKILFINYKDLASNSVKVLPQICNYLNINFNDDTLNYNHKDYFQKQMGHNLGGNLMRVRKIKPIVYSNKWKENLKLTDKIVYNILGGEFTDRKFEKLDNGIHIK